MSISAHSLTLGVCAGGAAVSAMAAKAKPETEPKKKQYPSHAVGEISTEAVPFVTYSHESSANIISHPTPRPSGSCLPSATAIVHPLK